MLPKTALPTAVGGLRAHVQGESLKARRVFLAETSQLPDHQWGQIAMRNDNRNSEQGVFFRGAGALLIAAALVTASTTSATARCRLAPGDCIVVADRIEYLRRYEITERLRLNFLSPFQRNLAASERTSAEERRIRDSLPPTLGREFIRLVGCDIREYGALLDGRAFNDPTCR